MFLKSRVDEMKVYILYEDMGYDGIYVKNIFKYKDVAIEYIIKEFINNKEYEVEYQDEYEIWKVYSFSEFDNHRRWDFDLYIDEYEVIE